MIIKEKEILSENDLLDTYNNFNEGEDNVTVNFSFYGNNANNDLAYFALNDKYYAKKVLQAFDHKNFNNNLT